MGRGATASVLEPLKKVLQIRRWKDARNNVQAVIQSLTQQAIKAAGLGVRLLGDQSFVLDSPFTSADPNFMKAIAEFLPGKAPQMLLLLAKQNWPDSVRETLALHISRVYGVRLHTPVTPNDPESFRFHTKGNTIDLREPIAAGKPAFSTFHEL